jgi:hypothetical protein
MNKNKKKSFKLNKKSIKTISGAAKTMETLNNLVLASGPDEVFSKPNAAMNTNPIGHGRRAQLGGIR